MGKIKKMWCSEKEAAYIESLLAECRKQELACIKEVQYPEYMVRYLHPVKSYVDRGSELLGKLEIRLELAWKGEEELRFLLNENGFCWIDPGDVFPKCAVMKIEEREISVYTIGSGYMERTFQTEKCLAEIRSAHPRVLSTTESILYILKHHCSLARFGDGEFNLCMGREIGFQKFSERIRKRLIEVLSCQSDGKLLVTIPEFCSEYNNVKNCFGEISFWEAYWYRNAAKLQPFLTGSFYGNTDVSRNTVFYENPLERIRMLWEGRDVVFVAGDNGRFEVKTELFDGIVSVCTIQVSPVHAFEAYDEILEQCRKESKDKLFLLSAGPTATVLAYDLAQLGYQALDIGHLPNCYDQYLGKIESPEALPYVR